MTSQSATYLFTGSQRVAAVDDRALSLQFDRLYRSLKEYVRQQLHYLKEDMKIMIADQARVSGRVDVVENAATEDEDDVAAEDAAEEATGEDAVDNAEAAADAAGVVDYVDSSDVASSSSPFPRSSSIASLSPITDGDDSSLSSPDAVSSSYVPTTSRKRSHDIAVQQDAPVVLKKSTREKGPRAVVPLLEIGDQLRKECRQANKADVLDELKSHKSMFYYCMRSWRDKVIGVDEPSIVQDGYVYYYINPFGTLGRLKRRATIAQIRSSTVGLDYFLHEDMEKLRTIYHNLSFLTHPDTGSEVTSWAEYDALCGGYTAREYYYLRFP